MSTDTNNSGPVWAFLAAIVVFFLVLFASRNFFGVELTPVRLLVLLLMFGLTFAFVYNEFFKK